MPTELVNLVGSTSCANLNLTLLGLVLTSSVAEGLGFRGLGV